MAQIKFTAKEKSVYNADETLSHKIIMVPVFNRRHCDMHAFRHHPKYDGIANSDLFPNALTKIRRDTFAGRDYFRLDRVPDGVTVTFKGFMTEVSFEV